MKRLVFLLVIISCQVQPDKPKEQEVISDNQRIDAMRLFCFYQLDDKYAEQSDTATLNTWLREKSALINASHTVSNLFDLQGGGPNGAEWNPSTALYLGFPYNGKVKFTIQINGELYLGENQFIDGVFWFKLPFDYWIERLKPISKADEAVLFPNSSNPNEPQQVKAIGEVLKIDIVFGGRQVSEYFYAAFGE